MVVGAAVWSGLANEQYNQVVLKNYELEQQIESYKENLDRLKNDLHQESVIQSIVVYVEEPPKGKQPLDVVTEKELKRRLKEDLGEFRGRNIYRISEDAHFAKKLIRNKIYRVGENDYAVTINTVLAADGVLKVWVKAELNIRP